MSKSPALGGTGDLSSLPSAFTPDDHGLVAWSGDPINFGGNSTISLGAVQWARMKLTKATPITNVNIRVRSAGATVSNAFIGVYDLAGNLLGQTADQSTTFQSTGAKVIPLTAPTGVLPAGTQVLVAVLVGAAGTAPQFTLATGSFPNDYLTAASPWRMGASGSGLTALPSPMSVSGATSGGYNFWAGLS